MVKKLLFVCLGNICRSPAAETIMQDKIKAKNLSEHFYCDSAGTGNYHVGGLADARMREAAEKRGYLIKSRARQIQHQDLKEFDYVVVMDKSNFNNVCALTQDENLKSKVVMMLNYNSLDDCLEVPDPYFGGDEGFQYVLNLLENACENLLNKLSH